MAGVQVMNGEDYEVILRDPGQRGLERGALVTPDGILWCYALDATRSSLGALSALRPRVAAALGVDEGSLPLASAWPRRKPSNGHKEGRST